MATEFAERKRWLFFGLPFTFTKYIIKENVLTIDSGFFKKVENDCYMYKIQDVELVSSLPERIFGLGTVICFTGDTTHPKLSLIHIKNARAVKEFILEASETARLKRRTINTVDIGAGDIDFDGDGIPD
ncbi:MAG: PH domain-containing protein [Suilimivivens sp.]